MSRSRQITCAFTTFALLLTAPLLASAGPATAPSTAPAVGIGPQIDLLQPEDGWTVPPELKMRARVTAATPPGPMDLAWRHGGEGLGGKVSRGPLGSGLALGQWSDPVPVSSLVAGKFPRTLFLTITAAPAPALGAKRAGKKAGGDSPRDMKIEIEFRYRDQLVKDMTEAGPAGATVGLVIPAGELAGGRTPLSPEFRDNLLGLLDYARRRADAMEKLPWAGKPVPTKFAILTDLGGYGEGARYAIRTTDPAVVEAECRTIRQLGVNGLRSAPAFLIDQAYRREGIGAQFTRIRDTAGMGFPITGGRRGKGAAAVANAARAADPEAGCPFAPGIDARANEGAAEVLARVSGEKVDEAWCLTVDEIGAVTERAPQGKSHVAVCPACAAGFRDYLQAQGVRPVNFGQSDWSKIAPLDVYSKDPAAPKPDLADPATALRAYWTVRFTNYATARLFTPLRDALAKANEEKRRAIDAGEKDSPAAGRPWLASYALRGNTFLMGGHSLDFFEFYRYADNAFVYEMSNRDPRVWQWDSYLCDVGRVVSSDRGIRFGVYVKPHRGAPIQRALSAVSRGATMLYWYTYGPDWSKGDTFGSDAGSLALASKAARLIAAGEDVLYGSAPASPAEIAVVSPRSSEIWMQLTGAPPARTAAWENAKWIYTAFTEAHLPVDPIDEGMLADIPLRDLARYKVIAVSGPNLNHVAAEKLASWVQAGGTLYTSGGGLALDEANRPLTALQGVLGLKDRKPPEMWKKVDLYKATALDPFDDDAHTLAPVPPGARIEASDTLGGPTNLIVGRESLDPADGTQTIARFADGAAAVTRHVHGKGAAYVVGLFPGLEYSAAIRAPHYDMSRDLDAARWHWVTFICDGLVSPTVDCDRSTVEGVLLRNKSTGKEAVTLMNWAYRADGPDAGPASRQSRGANLVPMENIRLTLHAASSLVGPSKGPPTIARSAALGESFPLTREGDVLTLTLPRLEEGDVLLLE